MKSKATRNLGKKRVSANMQVELAQERIMVSGESLNFSKSDGVAIQRVLKGTQAM